ncbi:hypothetical protein GCM10009623_39980 [Nocardioides aestuarii]|uniref:Copper transporter n=1 Tax=Nocardioides aestuarii TaxID=252231 RepID=A0ABW4TRU9_9ACTN
MSAVRRHLTLVAALVLVLAIGIALGAGPLSHERLLPTAAAPVPTAPEGVAGPEADAVAAEVAPALLRGRLAGRGVALLSTPGVGRDTLTALADDVERAGGTVTARWSAGRSLVGPGEKTLVDTLGEQLLEQLDGRGADADSASYDRMGQLVATAIATRTPEGAVAGPDALTVRQSLDAASLLRVDRDEPRRSPLLLVVLGDDLDDHVVEGLVTGLVARTSGVVVAGSEGAADLDVLASAERLTTVDGVEGELGRLAAVLALSRVEDQPGGSFGASGSDSALPLG